MVTRDGHTQVVFKGILLCAHMSLQQLHTDFGRSVGLGVPCRGFFGDYFPGPMVPQLAEEGNDGYPCIAAKGDALIP